MINNLLSLRIKRPRKHGNVGDSPGSIIISQDALKPQINVLCYNKTEMHEEQSQGIDHVLAYVKERAHCVCWIEIRGLGDLNLIKKIGAGLGVESLVLEDITDTTQRPKYDEYDGFIMAISRLLFHDGMGQIVNGQFSILVKDGLLISFQDTYDEHFAGVKNRLRTSKGIIREEGTGYLMYALMDTLFDRYFAILDKIEETLTTLEDQINHKPKRQNMFDAQQLKRLLITMQRATSPERDKMHEILRSNNPHFTSRHKVFFQDAYDHCIDIIETTNSLKELSTNLTEIYLSTVNNQMNDVMRILTIISSIFIPLTFIAGIYGMNFVYEDPATGKVMTHNMPELHNPNGYVYTLVAMGAIAVIQLVIFWRKGWFDRLK